MTPPIYVGYESFAELKDNVGEHLYHYSDAKRYSEYKPNGKFIVSSYRHHKDPMYWRAWVVMKGGRIKHVEFIKGRKK
tara:strand:- start:115 stop:348 length:234 start_codon:yes stop_codon:yes gene_type:complete